MAFHNRSQIPEYNPNIIQSKSFYVNNMIRNVRETGGDEFWVLNKNYLEIYYFKVTQITDFDIQIDLVNALEKEIVFSGMFVMHMKDNILKLMEEVPGKIYLKKLDCYRDLYSSLIEKEANAKGKKTKHELIEKIDFIESEFPQFII